MMKFLIADDHPLYREALCAALDTEFSGVSYLESDSFASTIKILRSRRTISVLLLDLTMPGCDNFYGLLRIRQMFPSLPIAVISASDSLDTISQVMDFGAQAHIPKTTPTSELIKAIKAVHDGHTWLPNGIAEQLKDINNDNIHIAEKVRELTPKQFQVLRLVKQGMKNKQIADALNVTEATVKAHISSLFKRLEVESRTQILVAIDQLQID